LQIATQPKVVTKPGI